MIGSIMVAILGIYYIYNYWKWARAMDQLNKDHFEYLKNAPIEGIDYFVATDMKKKRVK